MRAFGILSCLILAAAKPQYNYEQPAAGQYYTSNVIQQQYPATAYVGQQQQQQQQQHLLPAVSAYTGGQNQAAYVQQQSLPVSYSSFGSSVASQSQTPAYPSQNIYTSYAQSPTYQRLIVSPAPGVSYTGYTGYTSLRTGHPSNAQTSFVHSQPSNNGYSKNVYSQATAYRTPLALKQSYLPAAYTAASGNANNVGTSEQFTNQHVAQAPAQQSTTIDHSAISVSSQSADLAHQQHSSIDHKLPKSFSHPLPEPSALPQVVSTSVPQFEQNFQSGYQQSFQNQPEQSYQAVEVEQSDQIQPEQHYQSGKQTYESQPIQTYLPAGVQQSFQTQSEQNYQQSYQAEPEQNLQSVEVEQSVQSQPKQSSHSVQQIYQIQPAQTYLPAGVQQSFQTQSEQNYQLAQQAYQTETAQNHQSVGVEQTFRVQPEQSIPSEIEQSFQTQPEQTHSEPVFQSEAVHSIKTHQQTFEPHTQLETEPRSLQPTVETTVHKSIYVHVPPEELEEDVEPLPVQPISPIKKHYKVIFIKAPSPAVSRQIIQQIQPQTEEKTLVYVLVKKPEAPEVHHVQQPEIIPTDKPEVYFIKYRTHKNSEQVPAVDPTVQAPAFQSVENAKLTSESTVIEPRQNQLSQKSTQFSALEEQNNLLSTEVANDEVPILATTKQPHHQLRLNNSKHLQKSGAQKPTKDYLPAN